MFASSVGIQRNANNVLRSFRPVVAKTTLTAEDWTPRKMRHSFVSLLSDSGIPIENIARLVGHAGGSEVTETVYRKQIRLVLLDGADAKLTARQRIRACAALRPGSLTDPVNATKAALRSLARRWQALQAEIDDLDAQLTPLVTTAAPGLVALPGVGVDTAGQLLVTAGDNPARLRTGRSFARLCGAAPIPVSSGRTDRHRLHRGGDRQANSALWRIALVRMHCHQPTKDYVARRTAEGKTKTEILRCLKRSIAREAYPLLAGHLSVEACLVMTSPQVVPGMRLRR